MEGRGGREGRIASLRTGKSCCFCGPLQGEAGRELPQGPFPTLSVPGSQTTVHTAVPKLLHFPNSPQRIPSKVTRMLSCSGLRGGLFLLAPRTQPHTPELCDASLADRS